MSDENKNNKGNDSGDDVSSINDFNFHRGNNFLDFIIKLFTVIYFSGIATSTLLIYIPYFMYIRYIPTLHTRFLWNLLVLPLFIWVVFVIVFLVNSFSGLYYFDFFKDQMKEEQKKFLYYDGKGFDEKIINKHRHKLLSINVIAIGIYALFLFLAINYYKTNMFLRNHFAWFWIMSIFVADLIFILLIISIKIVENKNKENPDIKFKCFSINWTYIKKNIFPLIGYFIIYFIYLFVLTIFILTLLPIFLKFISQDKLLDHANNLKIFLAAIFFAVILTFANAVSFDFVALYKNRKNKQYFNKYIITDISVPLIIFLFIYFTFQIYKFPFSYFKLGNYRKNVIVNKSGMSILEASGCPNISIRHFKKKRFPICSAPNICYEVKSFIFSNIGNDVYLKVDPNKLVKGQSKSIYKKTYKAIIPKKDFLFLSYKNHINKKCPKNRRPKS